LTFIFLTLAAQTSWAVQDVYEYQNAQGVTEFTDQVKADKEPVKQMQIKKMTAEEEAQSEAKLEQIIEKDKALDERVKLQRQLENERNLRLQREQESRQLQKDQQSEQSSDSNGNNNYRDDLWIRRPIVRPPNRPVKARPGPSLGR